MKVSIRFLLVAVAGLVSGAAPLSGQVLHVNDRWKDCAFVIHPSLTQEAWRQFVGEIGVVSYFRPLASARPIGRRKIEVALLSWASRIDAADDAWNDTFSHPDSTHWLFEGDALMIPGLMLRAGVTDRVDVGAYITKNVNSNYGLVGGQVQYNLLDDRDRNLAAAGRVSVVRLFGPDDLTTSVYGVDVVVSRSMWRFSPYVGVSGSLSRGHEHSADVNLDSESVFGVQGTAGLAVDIAGIRLGAEFTTARVQGYSIKLGYGT